MCEYCGCRNTPEIAALGAEHDAIVDLADRVVEGVRSGTMSLAEGVARLRELLVPHVRREESGVFRVAERIGLRNQYVDDLEDDHRRYGASLGDPDSLSPDTLEALLDDLYHHIAVEEYDLFPVVARELERDRTPDLARPSDLIPQPALPGGSGPGRPPQ